MISKPKIIVITGAESTGKSTLSRALAKHFDVPFLSEYARDYIQDLERDYTFSDVEYIAKQQIAQLDKLLSENHSVIILDTWLLITKIWFEVVFNSVPAWLEKKIQETPIDICLVCDTDLPWIADKVRENGGEKRELLQQRYIDEIKKSGFKYELVSGVGAARTNIAIQYISKL